MAIEHHIESPLARAVRAADGQSAFARIIKRSQSYVYKLLRDGKPLPAEETILVDQAKLGFSKEQLRPDLFGPEPASPPLSGNVEPAR